jgi:selenocysteine-specific elongation factor
MEIEDLINPTSLAGSPVVAVSSVTKQGIPELKAAIDKALDTTEPRKDIGKPRLPIDRVFTISGSGTVVTGTLIDGSLSVGQEVEVIPPALKSRIRSLQTHKTQLNKVGPGSRVAANIVGVNAADLNRGYTLTNPGWLRSTKMLDARLRLLKQPERPLRHNTEVSFHTGAAEVTARIRLLEKEEVQPGETTWVQFILEEPLAVVKGDHYVIRSPMDTLGGGVILEAHPKERHRRFRPEIIENLKARSEGKIEETILAVLKTRQFQEISVLLSQSGLAADVTEATIDSLIEQGKVVKIGEGKNSLLFTETNWKQLVDNIVTIVADYHRKFPVRLGISKAEISSKIKLGSRFPDILQRLFKDGVLVEETALVRLPSHQIKLSSAHQSRIDAYMKQLTQNPYAPAPTIEIEPDL